MFPRPKHLFMALTSTVAIPAGSADLIRLRILVKGVVLKIESII